MPRVQQYEPNQIETRLPNTERASLPPDTGLNTLAAGVNQLAVGVDNMAKRFDETAADEALQKFEREKNEIFFAPETGYFNTQGRNAFDAADGTASSLNDLKEKYASELSSERARQAFSRAADVHITRGQADIMRHSSKGFESWEIATMKAGVENAIESGAKYWADEDSLLLQHTNGRSAVIEAADREGIGAEAKNERLQNYDTAFASAAISAALTHSSTEAEKLLVKHEKWLEEPDKIKIESQIAAKKEAEYEAFISAHAVNKAKVLVDQFDNRKDILAAVNEIDEPRLFKKVMSETMYQLGLKESATEEAKQDAYLAAEDYIAKGSGSMNQWIAENEDLAAQLSVTQLEFLGAGHAVVTDFVGLSDLLLLPEEKLAKVKPSNHFHSLGNADKIRLVNAVKAAKDKVNAPGGSDLTDKGKLEARVGQTHTTQMKQAAIQLFGEESKWDTKLDKVNAFYQLATEELRYQQSLQEDKILTTDEFDKVLRNLTKSWVKERNWLPDPEYDLADLSENEIRDIPRFLREHDMPRDAETIMRAKLELPKVIEYLKKNNIPVTDRTVMQAWKQATR